jgi:hypothetical protein
MVFRIASAQISSQTNTWDVPLTEILIAQNKTGHGDHLDMHDNQLASTATVSLWKQRQLAFRQLVDRIDQRLSSVFIVLADAALVYEVAKSFEEMIDQQQQTLRLLARHPYAAPMVLQEQERIIRDATDLFRFVNLMVVSYGDLSKMKASSRQAIYRQLRDQVQVLRSRCYGIHQTMQRIDLAQVLRQTKVGQFVQQDRAIVQDILKMFQ